MSRVAIACALVVAAAAASLAADPVRTETDGATVDWTAGTIEARGVAAGNLRTPSAQVARIGAEREARRAAREQLLERARELPLAGGSTVGARAAGDPALAARLGAAVERSIAGAIDYSTDGSVILTEKLPLEAVRLAVRGAPEPPPKPDGPTAVIVAVAPEVAAELQDRALGLALVAGTARYEGPTVFHRGAKSARNDSRLGPRVVELAADGYQGGALRVAGDGAEAAVQRLRKAGALVVVMLPEKAG